MALARIKKSKIKKIDIINIKGGMTAKQVMAKYNPDWLCNLALYDVGSGTNITFLEDENVKSGSYFAYDGIGIKGDKEIIWCTKDEAFTSKEIRDYVSGSPNIIENGKKVKDWGNKYSSYVDGSHKRMAIGFSNDEVVLLASDNNNTLDGLANYVLANVPSIKYMINCDGGGSVHLQNKGKIYSNSTRANASWLLIWLEEEKPPTTGGDNVQVTKTKIKLNGVIKEVETINLNGTNFIKLRDLADDKIIVDYDAVNKLPVVAVK